VLLGHIGGAPVYISASQFEVWKHTDLIIDVGRSGAPIPQVSYCTVTRKLWVSCANRRADDPTNDPHSRLSPLGGCSPRRAGRFFDRPISAKSRGEHLTFQVKPKGPAGCKMVGTVKGTKLVGG
jgi:hypothetical protein